MCLRILPCCRLSEWLSCTCNNRESDSCQVTDSVASIKLAKKNIHYKCLEWNVIRVLYDLDYLHASLKLYKYVNHPTTIPSRPHAK
jgi:hypothetical protein